MLVKYNVDTTKIGDDATRKAQAKSLKTELSALRSEESKLRSMVSSLEQRNKNASSAIETTSSNLAQIQKNLTSSGLKIKLQQQKLSELQNKIRNTAQQKTSDVIKDTNVGEENYLIGLKVEGRRIAVLLDSSSSMTDEVLIDIIRRKNASDKTKQSGPKWLRTKRIIRWLLARLPEGSKFDVISYSDKAKTLGEKGWKSSKDPKLIDAVRRDLDSLVPEGPTNLQVGLKALSRPTHVYLITDGLPTAGDSNYRSLNPFASCNSLWGKSNTISGECRLKLFQHSVRSSAPGSGVRINVILLPIEGDPAASIAYWSWTSASGGMLITPAESWP
tara:strand:+ start:623 stop:1618 length:996 start_codon:yes stop_codon:yes gene_type:complete